MANMKLVQVLVVLAGLIVAGLVKANPLPQSLTVKAVESANVAKANPVDWDDCCILDFTHVLCVDHTAPICSENNCCGPVPPPIGFSYASNPLGNCVNVLDGNGNPTTYNQFWILRCTGYTDSVELYARNDCQGSYWNQINTPACYHNGGGIGSFRLIANQDPNEKRSVLGGALVNETDPHSTSGYAWHENNASVTPPEQCFDKETGAYILGCKVGRTSDDADIARAVDEFPGGPSSLSDSSDTSTPTIKRQEISGAPGTPLPLSPVPNGPFPLEFRPACEAAPTQTLTVSSHQT